MEISDIDECSLPAVNPCHSNAICSNTQGSYTCTCAAETTGDGVKSCLGKTETTEIIKFQLPFCIHAHKQR